MGMHLSPLLRQFALQEFACKEDVDECSAANRFTGDNADGFPQAGVVRDSSGNLYGTTQNDRDSAGNLYGTTPQRGSNDFGVSKIDTKGNETVIHTFSGSDGQNPLRNPPPRQGGKPLWTYEERSLRRRRVQDRSLINKQDAERAHHLTNPGIVIPKNPSIAVPLTV
jgi:hypothetical protein